MARSILKPTLKAMRAIIAAARELGDDATWDKLVEATGYDLQLIKQVMRNKPRIKQKLLVNPPAPLPTMPKWVAEIMKTTGLELVFHKTINKCTQQWVMISPTGVPVLWLAGDNNAVAREVRTMRPTMIPMLQGITTEQHKKRRRRNAKKKEGEQDPSEFKE